MRTTGATRSFTGSFYSMGPKMANAWNLVSHRLVYYYFISRPSRSRLSVLGFQVATIHRVFIHKFENMFNCPPRHDVSPIVMGAAPEDYTRAAALLHTRGSRGASSSRSSSPPSSFSTSSSPLFSFPFPPTPLSYFVFFFNGFFNARSRVASMSSDRCSSVTAKRIPGIFWYMRKETNKERTLFFSILKFHKTLL